MQKALVTGANGFIGSHLVDGLVSEGVAVRCLVRKTSNLRWLNHPNIEFAYGELMDIHSLHQAVSGVDVVFHLAGKTKAATREDYFQTNATGTENLLRAVLHKSKNLKRFVYVSTQAAAGPSRDKKPVRESDAPHPVTWYGESKLSGEKTVLEFSSKIPVVVVRPPSVFGSRDTDMFQLFKIVCHGIRPLLGWQKRFFSVVYVEDLVKGLLFAAKEKQAVGRTFFVNTEDCVSWQDFGAAIARACGKKTIPLVVPVSAFVFFVYVNDWVCKISGKATILNRSKIPEFVPRYWTSDSSKIRRELGFVPKYGLSESIQKTAAWYKKEGWL